MNIQKKKALQRAEKYCNKFLKFVFRATSTNYHVFQYVNRCKTISLKLLFIVNILRKKFRNHMVCREKAKNRFDRYLDKAKFFYAKKVEIGEIEGEISNIDKYITERVSEQLFFLMFQFQVIEFLQDNYQKKMEDNTTMSQEFENFNENSLNSDRKLFKLKWIIKFKETIKKLEDRPFYFLYNKITEKCEGIDKLEDYVKLLQPPPSSSRKRPTDGEKSTATFSVSKTKYSLTNKKKKFFNNPVLTNKIKEGTFQYRMMLKEKEEREKIKDEMSKKKHTKGIMNKLKKDEKSGFRLKVGKTYLFIAITTIIEYFSLHPSEFEAYGVDLVEENQFNFVF